MHEPPDAAALAEAPLPPGHRHEASIEDALDFVNTLEFSAAGSEEALTSAADLLVWLRERGLIHPETERTAAARLAADPPAEAGLLGRGRELRAAFRALLEAIAAACPAPAGALGTINAALRSGYAYELVPAPDGVRLDHRHPPDDPGGALASLAAALVSAVSEGATERLKVCANDECRWVFRDASPAGRRRWCDMKSCGNRAKARRHRERVRASAAVATPGDGAGHAAGDGPAVAQPSERTRSSM